MKKGFTLVELLVTVAVIAILAGIIGININNARKQAGLTQAKIEIEEIANAGVLYQQDTGTWPFDSRGSCCYGKIWNSPLFNNKYINTNSYLNLIQQDPISYLGNSGALLDWQSWGNYYAVTDSSKANFGKICDYYKDPSCNNGDWFSVFPKLTTDYTLSHGSPPANPALQIACWQSVDLYEDIPPGGTTLVYRKCVRDTCPGQYYCRDSQVCYNTAYDRDHDINPIGRLDQNGNQALSAVCEDCSGTGYGPGTCKYKYNF